MAITTQTFPLPYGATLVFHYDDTYPQSEQVGTLDYYQGIINQLVYQSLEYYNQPDGTNKFLKHVTLHIWADQIPYDVSPDNQPYEQTFWTFRDANGFSHINAHWLDYNQASLSYRYPASLSHEFGHAYHNFCGWPANDAWGKEVSDFWNKEVIGSNAYPSGWNRFEAFANAFRCLKGVATTRGISGALNGGSDPIPFPMQDPNNHPEWRKQFDLMPELCGYMAKYGCTPGTLEWYGGVDGQWTFEDLSGNWVSIKGLGDGWMKWGFSWWPFGWNWQPFSPQYTL